MNVQISESVVNFLMNGWVIVTADGATFLQKSEDREISSYDDGFPKPTHPASANSFLHENHVYYKKSYYDRPPNLFLVRRVVYRIFIGELERLTAKQPKPTSQIATQDFHC